MANHPITTEQLKYPESLAAFRLIKVLAGLYIGVNIAALMVIILLSNNTQLVNDVVWTRGIILTLTSFILLRFIFLLVRGSRKAYLLIRISTSILFVSVVVLLTIPNLLPLWMKVEQAICGILLLGIILGINNKHLRSLFK